MENKSDNVIAPSNPKQFQKALCGRCGYMLALKGNNEVSVRNGELYFYFYSGMLSIICRGCAANNLIIDEHYELTNADKVKALLARVNVIRAEYEPWKSRKEKDSEKTSSFKKTIPLGENKNV